MSINNVRFLTQNDVIAIGYYGTIIRSTDAGLTWSNPLTTSSLAGFENLVLWNTSFINPTTGFMVGNNSGAYTKLYKTTNSGKYWSPVSTHLSLGESVQFLNESTGWITTSLFTYKTTNGGASWDSNSVPMPSLVRDIHFIDAFTGFSCLSRRIYKTSNGGMTWNMIDSINADFANLYFLNADTGFVTGHLSPSGGLIRKTTDAGLTWETTLFSPQTSDISSMNFINSSTGFAVGGGFSGPGRIFKSTNSGNSWVLQQFTSNYHFNSITFSGNNIIAVGYGGKVLRSSDTGNSWSESASFHDPESIFTSVSFIDAATGWVTTGNGGPGRIYRTLNGGATWENVFSGFETQNNKLQFFNANTGYYIIENIVYKSTNGGFNWAQMPALNINLNNSKITFYDINTGYASGNYNGNSRILRTTNGAQSWDTIKCVYAGCTNVSSVKFIDMSTGWISVSYCLYPPPGIRSRILKTTNSGTNWTELRNDSGFVYDHMDFKNNSTGWVSGGTRILSTYDGGNTWNVQQLPGSIKSLSMVNSYTGWINLWSYGGRILKTTNSGLNWDTQFDLGTAGIMYLKFINESTGWAVGSEGMILKTTNGGELLPVINLNVSVSNKYSLLQNYPNPFNPSTKIKFNIPPSGQNGNIDIKLVVYDILGREVAVLLNKKLAIGTYEVNWDASAYSSGVYFYSLETKNLTETRKMVLLK